ncbi:MAG: hypothetical protein ACXW4M_13350 [Anaerolineales bacterium]
MRINGRRNRPRNRAASCFGLEAYLRQAYQTISQRAVKVAFHDVSEEK